MNATALDELSSPTQGFVWQRDRRTTPATASRVGLRTARSQAGAAATAPARRSFALDWDAYYASERNELPL